ncbi:hypothetical protein Desdi_2512 [Desulfitobacterium dichloroeliminans LMG P-21439]|uniref:Uncharacterized protein n=1 Tax=Desulfitobacterium dichloroeliminans (strain LMG P-21439 / DCA1) TaxID=871963 RepID=L0FA75_DESDL|nr:hypothetical protein [Desulfitobacterium dichloroeliminans]AGA69935.1 hypothetical protein Desdi_2512 [Desulfitobacterium dichloroeliminans LMG P-21439]
MAFAILVLLEWLLLLAAAMIFIGGIRGALAATLIMSGILWYTHPDNFWLWELIFLSGVGISIGILYYFLRKAGQSNIVAGLAGGIASLVIFGAFITPLLAILAWALVVGVGLIPKIKFKEVAWGFSPVLWRAVMGLLCVVVGNILI